MSSSHESEEDYEEDVENTMGGGPLRRDEDAHLEEVLRQSREEYEQSRVVNQHEEDMDQIAEAMRLSLKSEMDRQTEEDRLFEDAITRSLLEKYEHTADDDEYDRQIREAVERSVMDLPKDDDIALKAALKKSVVEVDSKVSASGVSQAAMEREKMRAARLRALAGSK
jgi:hypothetical protein